ncbi:MAG: GntR family transcriptional regulator [Planctomycetia bacterium]|nr:GntR family transcriptional regulator [Planctomycetia bacterium]
MSRKSHDILCQEIQKRILLGKLLPGTRLSEVALASELGVSRTPLREAFHSLVSQGILEHRETGGVFVKVATEEDIRELYEMRLWLEPEVARKAATAATEKQCEMIREACRKEALLCEKLRECSMPLDYSALNAFRIFEVEIPFHGAQCEAANNQILTRVLQQMRILKRSWMLQGIQFFSIDETERIAQEHTAIAEAIFAHDGDRAATLTREHIATAHARISQMINTRNASPTESQQAIRDFLGLKEPDLPW